MVIYHVKCTMRGVFKSLKSLLQLQAMLYNSLYLYCKRRKSLNRDTKCSLKVNSILSVDHLGLVLTFDLRSRTYFQMQTVVTIICNYLNSRDISTGIYYGGQQVPAEVNVSSSTMQNSSLMYPLI